MNNLIIKDLSYVIDERMILNHVNMEVPEGACVVITGHNGSGKSTLLKLVHQGHPNIIKNGRSVMLHQNINDNLFCTLSVFENFQLIGIDDEAVVAELLSRFKSQPSLDTCVARLSGGERQRLAFYMRLLLRPHLLLLDEFTSALDPETSRVLMQEMLTVTRQYNITVLVVTHDFDLVRGIECMHFEMNSGLLRQMTIEPMHK